MFYIYTITKSAEIAARFQRTKKTAEGEIFCGSEFKDKFSALLFAFDIEGDKIAIGEREYIVKRSLNRCFFPLAGMMF